MSERFLRTELLLGKEAMSRLQSARVAVFGIGGVGGHAVEALVRSGIGSVALIDNDKVSITNINRQMFATESTIGEYKTEVAKKRLSDINPEVEIETHNVFYMPDTASQFDFKKYDYIIDAVDTVTAKLEIIVNAKKADVPVISSMGAGNKLDASRFEVADIYETSVCPLARVMRRELKQRDIEALKVVYSKEIPITPIQAISDSGKRVVPGSVAFVPSVAGLIIAGEVVKDLINYKTFSVNT